MEKNSLEKIAESHNFTLDYLSSGSPIFQVENFYAFTSDSIKLAHAVTETEAGVVVDLCSGSGVVGLELIEKLKAQKLYLVELQKELADASELSAKFTKTDTLITVLNRNVVGVSEELGEKTVDIVVSNPPYFKVGSGDMPANFSRALARHELKLTLNELVLEALKLLKSGGKFYMVHLLNRLPEIEKSLTKNNLKIVEKIELPGKLKRVIISAIKI